MDSMEAEIFFHKFENDNTLPMNVQRKLLNLYNKYKQLGDEEKQKFHKAAIDALTKALRKVPDKAILPTSLVLLKSYIPFILVTSCVMLLFVISRRVFHRICERQQRHKEKKKLKQQKKAEAKLQKAKKKKQ